MRIVEQLSAEITRGPIAAALAARSAVSADAEAAAAIVDDGDAEMSVRVAALLALALVAQDRVPVPDTAVFALEDDLLIDAILACGATSAITGIVAAAKDRVSGPLMRYLAVRVAASGADGMHVAELLLGAGNADAAVRAAVPSLVTAMRDATDDDIIVLALATIVDEWAAAHAGIDDRIAAALPQTQRETLLRGLGHVRAAR